MAVTTHTYTINTTTPSTVTYGAAGVGGAGTFLTAGSNGSSYSTTWTNPNSRFTSSNNKAIMTIPHGEEKVVLEKEATLEVKGNVKINGVDLEDRLKVIETVLNIPTRDTELEEKYPKLKLLYEEYMKELEKYKTWERIKR